MTATTAAFTLYLAALFVLALQPGGRPETKRTMSLGAEALGRPWRRSPPAPRI